MKTTYNIVDLGAEVYVVHLLSVYKFKGSIPNMKERKKKER